MDAPRRGLVLVAGMMLVLAGCGSARQIPTERPQNSGPGRADQQTLRPASDAPASDPTAGLPSDPMPESTTGRAPESFDPAPGPSQIVPGQGDICAPLGATWSPQRLLGRGAEFHEAAIPDTDLDIGFAERGTLVAYLGQDPAGYADRWDAWWTAWRAVQAIDHTRARKWLVVEHQGRFYPFEARTPDWSPQVDEFGRFPEGQFPPPGPCRFPIEDGQMISWTAIGLFAPLGTLKMEWVRYAWSVPNMLDCARLTHPCLQVSGGIGWWCATEDVYPEIAAGWYNCNVINPTSINVARPVV